ncbi:cholinesterase 2-like [Haliotis rubra]|uniref:cholinesterase 2-like n=1 Tax=Haliotis rubra TaxID=36100 RepID=UPI001EE5CADF|nr:cholinesterase 2-like [Haliotis rubra]
MMGVVIILSMSSLSLTQDVSTTSGRLRGNRLSVLGKSVDVYHGVRFAKPPVGDLRFKHPVAFEANNSGITYAQVPGPSCIQPKIPLFLESFKQIPDYYSEDCLHLSIWTPTNNTGNLSVMIWVYGGGFYLGSGQMPLHNGAVLAVENNVIVVTINYRLGPLGFAYLGPGTVPGNMGLMDQRMAFKWVKTNVANFGGDANRITIFGESAGGISVGLHVLSPLSRDTFDRAIMESGPISESFTYLDAHTSKDITIKLAEKLKCPTHTDVDIFECLKYADAQSMAGLQLTLGVMYPIPFAPVIDKYFLPEDPKTLLDRGEYKNTELLHGFNKDEATLFVMTLVTGLRNLTLAPQNLILSSAEYEMMIKSTFMEESNDKAKEALSIYYKSLQPPGNVDYFDVVNNLQSDVLYNCPVVEFGSVFSRINPTFLYGFNHRISTNPFPAWTGAAHGFEIELVFGLPLNASLGFDQDEATLSRTMMTYWTNFAKTGNPNSPVPVPVAWPAYDNTDRNYLKLDVGSNLATGQSLRHQQCTFVNKLLPMIPGDDVQHTTKAPFSCPRTSAGSHNRSFLSLAVVSLSLVIRQLCLHS